MDIIPVPCDLLTLADGTSWSINSEDATGAELARSLADSMRLSLSDNPGSCHLIIKNGIQYGARRPELPLILDKVYTCLEVVKIDYQLPGCPPSGDTLWQALTALLKGQPADLPYGLIRYD